MMRPRLLTLSLLLVTAAAAAPVRAQERASGFVPAISGPPQEAPSGYLTGPYLPVYSNPAVPLQSVYWPPYSYWAAYPLPARDYVGYGSHDFAFYGRRYGSASDPWSWSGIAGYPAQYRYYSPPVR